MQPEGGQKSSRQPHKVIGKRYAINSTSLQKLASLKSPDHGSFFLSGAAPVDVRRAKAVSPRLRAWIAGDVRKAYYTLAILFIIAIGIIIHLALPTELLQISANMANFASLIFPFVLIYLNAKLPKPARARWWSTVILLANVVFFGFFFFNFVSLKMAGQPLVKF